MRVREGQEEEYIRRHKEIWPEVVAGMLASGVHSMSIYMAGRQLFLYMEVENYAEMVRLHANDPNSLRWEEYMAPIMENAAGEDYDPNNAYPAGLPEVFHWPFS